MDKSDELQKMLAGELYFSADPSLVAMRTRARRLCRAFNQTTEEELPRREALLRELLGAVGQKIEIEPPFLCDYGAHIFAGENLYINFGCVILDCAKVTFGKNVMLAPGVHIYAAYHPMERVARASGREFAAPVTIGDDVWIGGGAILCPGVTIGEGTVIGAGSVVVRDIPANVLAVGNPCRVVRPIEQGDRGGAPPG